MRAGVVGDAEAVARIYNAGIEERVATFEARLREPEEVGGWFGVEHPTLVAEEGEVIGFATVSKYRSRECYDGVAEFSVYVDAGARGSGVGVRLMEAPIRACAEAGFWKLVSRVFAKKLANRALLRRTGFREVGVYERHARLDGVWKDVVIVERLL